MRNQNNLRNKKQNVIFDRGKIIEINDKDMPQSKKKKKKNKIRTIYIDFETHYIAIPSKCISTCKTCSTIF